MLLNWDAQHSTLSPSLAERPRQSGVCQFPTSSCWKKVPRKSQPSHKHAVVHLKHLTVGPSMANISVCVWINSPLIIVLSASLNAQRLFVRRLAAGACLSLHTLFYSSQASPGPSYIHSHCTPIRLLLYSFLQHLPSISSLPPPTVPLTQRTVSRPRSSPSSLPGQKNKQPSTCSQGILMTSITPASSPAKAQAARGEGDGPVYQHWWPVL